MQIQSLKKKEERKMKDLTDSAAALYIFRFNIV